MFEDRRILVLAPEPEWVLRGRNGYSAKDYAKRRVSRVGREQEPPVGFEPTTARLRIESSTTELRWRGPNLAMCSALRYSTSALRPPSLDPFAHDQGQHR